MCLKHGIFISFSESIKFSFICAVVVSFIYSLYLPIKNFPFLAAFVQKCMKVQERETGRGVGPTAPVLVTTFYHVPGLCLLGTGAVSYISHINYGSKTIVTLRLLL